MTAVLENIVPGSGAKKTRNGWETTRVAYIVDAGGNPTERAVVAIEASGFVIGQVHPDFFYPYCVVKSINAEPGGGGVNDFEVTASYGPAEFEVLEPFAQSQISINTTTAQETTNRDWKGDFVVVECATQEVTKQTCTMSKLVPRTSIQLKRLEDHDPLEKSKAYTGKVNVPGWRIDPSAPQRTWFCSGINGNSSDGGTTFEVTYDFAYLPNSTITYDDEDIGTVIVPGWDQVVTFTDPETGKIPDDVIDPDTGVILIASAVKVVQVYEMVSFNGLNL